MTSKLSVLGSRLILVLILVPLMALGSAIEPFPFDNEVQERRFRALAEEIRCTVCQNQSLADSDAPLAQDLRRELFAMLQDGRSDMEIREFMVDRYGDFVLYRPPLAGHTILLWAGPLLLLVIALVSTVVIVRRRRKIL
ncbi:cytochrome c-type biogenesis protein CcmH [Wenzhouxiangella sp. AB-CW3]|uniref:cytochrome c-type biogenesis protein n=1 Tax=Wenzhouxiangella sp. AB-CW3 TaxID=2771012 RepID=UPI00168AFE95|nr:cytochrome c-type biogenesis protein [Wenzhouxiangella sp. AB-CW3]QOC21380.1 cytochrome c-type biogenesis protein CcmH [Wenzhouxiangella sp. AB-CW3]